MRETKKAEALLARGSAEVERIKEQRKNNAVELAPDFYIFDYLRNNENGLSKCIGLLLNPKGKHAQGSVFLEQFLALIDQKLNDQFSSFSKDEDLSEIPQKNVIWANVETNKCIMTLERSTEKSRRIDIHLQFNDTERKAIGIESKPWASDGNHQLSHYADYLKNNNKHNLLIYLSNDEPDKNSIEPTERNELEKQGEFLILSFKDLNEWLERCATHAKAPVVKTFIRELKKYIDKEINGKRDMNMNNALAELLIEQENFETAQLLTNALETAKDNLITKLRNELSKASKDHQFSLDWSKAKYEAWIDREKHAGFGINFCPNQTFVFELYFEFRNADLKGFMWGIRRKSETTKLNDDHWRKINEVMRSKYPNYDDQTKGAWKDHNWWPWWTYYDFKDNFKRWDKNHEPWMAIIDDSLVSEIMLLAKEIDELFKTNGDETNLLKCQAT